MVWGSPRVQGQKVLTSEQCSGGDDGHPWGRKGEDLRGELCVN